MGIFMTKPKLGDTLPIREKLKNFLFNRQKGFRPRIGVVYHPKTLKKVIEYEKPDNFANAIDRWWKYKVTKIRVMATFNDKHYPCNFKVLDENKCKIYFRKPHTKKTILSLTLPVSDLEFNRNRYFERNGNSKVRVKNWGTVPAKKTTFSVYYEVKINDLTKNNETELIRYLSINKRKQIVRRRGTAIIDTPKGILVVAGRKELYILPGGGAEHNESREEAVAREVMEETGLKVVSSKYLFEHNDAPERRIQNLHKVFLLGVTGKVKPDGHEVRHIRYWKLGSDVPISNTTRLLIQKYIDEFKTK